MYTRNSETAAPKNLRTETNNADTGALYWSTKKTGWRRGKWTVKNSE